MNNFFLSLLISFIIFWHNFKISLNNALNNIVKFIKYVIYNIKYFLQKVWKFLKYITLPFRKALYEYTIAVFFICLFISLKYPEWKYADYIWLMFFFSLMLSLLVDVIKDKT